MDASQLLKGVLPTTALAVIAVGDTYGYQVLSELRARGLDSVGDASVYGTLQRLYEEGSVSSYMVASSSGPQRKYYSITDDGRAALKTGQEQWQHFQSVVTQLLDVADGIAS